jgi:hypothetical protein
MILRTLSNLLAGNPNEKNMQMAIADEIQNFRQYGGD